MASSFGDEIFLTAPDGILIVDAEGRIIRANPEAAKLFGRTIEQLQSGLVEDLIAEELREAHRAHRRYFSAHPRTRPMGAGLDLHALRADGSSFPVDVALSQIDIDGRLCVVASVRNITERHIADQELQAARSRLAILEERERIARDLHDIVIQEVFASGLGLQAALGQIGDPETRAALAEIVDRLDRTITRLRQIIFDFRRAPGGGQLRTAIEELSAAAAADLGFEPEIVLTGDPETVSGVVEQHLIPTLREGLANIARHSKAGAATVLLDIDGSVTLTITDDGEGLDPDYVPGFGFANMAERASRLGGSFAVNNLPGAGMRIIWTVPASPTVRPGMPRST